MPFDYAGDWRNQLGATMSLTVAPDGSAHGQYRSPAATAAAPLSGFVEQGRLVFSVAMDTSVGTMLCHPSGTDDPNSFSSWWHFELFDDAAPSWARVRTGCDTFTRA